MVIVFLVSAFLHEWIASNVIHSIRYEFFMAMIFQVPIIFIQQILDKYEKKIFGETTNFGN